MRIATALEPWTSLFASEATCPASTSGFDAKSAASAHSQLAGVIAAVIFTGMILLLGKTDPETYRERSRQNALLAMLPSFLGMLVTSFCFAVTTGEVDCRRADAATISIGGLFAVSAVGTLYALAWLLDSHQSTVPVVSSLSGTLVYVVSGLAIAQMGLTVLDFQQKYSEYGPIEGVIWAYIGIGLAVILVMWRSWKGKESREKERASPSALAMVASIVLAVTLFNITISIGVSEWQGRDAPVISIFAVGSTLAYIMLPMLAMLKSTPHRLVEDNRARRSKTSRPRRSLRRSYSPQRHGRARL